MKKNKFNPGIKITIFFVFFAILFFYLGVWLIERGNAKKLIMNETLIDLTLINLEPNNRYRLNCTYFDSDGELYWYGKMINVTDKKIIF